MLGVRGTVQVISLSNDIDSTVTNRSQQNPVVGSFKASERYVLPCAHRTIFFFTGRPGDQPLLTTDDAVMSRTVTCCWNEVYRHGALEDFYLMMLQSDLREEVSL